MSNPEDAGALTEEHIRAVIETFLRERLQPKLDKIDKKIQKSSEDDPEQLEKLNDEREKELNKYDYHNWLADGARRAAWIQQSTHPIKYSHPDARGTSPNAPGNPEAGNLILGTHTIAKEYQPDVVGNAAALDVNKFLSVEVGGVSLLDLAKRDDPSLKAAFTADRETAQEWTTAFAGIGRGEDAPISDKFVKQLYWPLGDGEYHLLAPMFPSSLAHVVRSRINKDRFSDEAKLAREARWSGNSHDHGYREYPLLAVQKFGGTKPQNISQLNSERHGENYLLSSCPPEWISESVRAPLRIKSVFDGWFGRRKSVRELTGILRDFLTRVREVNNIRIRAKRAELVAYLRDELIQFASEIQELPAGWSRDKTCRLNQEEQCWLDPGRAKTDEVFAAIRIRGTWRDGVSLRFSNWLNARLTGTALAMGEDEAREWRSVMDKELRMLRLEMEENE